MNFNFYFPIIQDKYNHNTTIQFFCFQYQKLCVYAKEAVIIARRESLTNPIKQNPSSEAGHHLSKQEAFTFCRTRNTFMCSQQIAIRVSPEPVQSSSHKHTLFP